MCPPSRTGIGRKFTTARFTEIIPMNSRNCQKSSPANRYDTLAMVSGPLMVLALTRPKIMA